MSARLTAARGSRSLGSSRSRGPNLRGESVTVASPAPRWIRKVSSRATRGRMRPCPSTWWRKQARPGRCRTSGCSKPQPLSQQRGLRHGVAGVPRRLPRCGGGLRGAVFRGAAPGSSGGRGPGRGATAGRPREHRLRPDPAGRDRGGYPRAAVQVRAAPHSGPCRLRKTTTGVRVPLAPRFRAGRQGRP
jgi:hypothetical protein